MAESIFNYDGFDACLSACELPSAEACLDLCYEYLDCEDDEYAT